MQANSERSALGGPESGWQEDSPGAIAEALGKLLVFAAVYPPEHVRVRTLLAPLTGAIARRAREDVPFTVEVVDEGLRVDDEVVLSLTAATRHLRRELELL